ncbi:MAG: hypothetical protein V4773_30600 [Verrucomicrobiota bacterium]
MSARLAAQPLAFVRTAMTSQPLAPMRSAAMQPATKAAAAVEAAPQPGVSSGGDGYSELAGEPMPEGAGARRSAHSRAGEGGPPEGAAY